MTQSGHWSPGPTGSWFFEWFCVKKTLYIVSTPPAGEGISLLPSSPSSAAGASVVLVQDGVRHQKLSVSPVFVLAEDATSRKVTASFPSISYRELLGMIFEADAVAVL